MVRSAAGPTTQQVAPLVPAPQITSRPVPGLGPNYTPPPPPPGSADLIRTYEALFGRTAIRLGPTNPRWSTFSGEMTPEGITKAIDTANAGQPFLFMDMCRRAVENDAAIGAAVELAFSRIVSEDDRTEPPRSMRRDPLAISLANWQRAVREQIEDFDRARYALLWAEGVGYSAAEIIWGYRPITWFTADNRRITRVYPVPQKLEIVDGRGFRFDIEEDKPYLWLDGEYRELPPAKFIWHESYRVTSVRERGGFMRSCLFLHAIKQWAWRDMAEYLHMYGLPQMVVEFDRKLYNYEEARQIARQLMEFMGQGGVPTVPLGINLRTDTPPPQWALVHGDAAKLMNQEIFRRIVLGLLTMTDSGGSYGLGDVHAEGAFMGTRLRANNLCNSMRRHLFTPALAMNVLHLAQDLGASPAEIMCALPDYASRLLREDTPEKRQAIFSQAMRDGCKVSATQYRAELQLDEPKDAADALEGEGVSVPSAGAVVSSVRASEGAKAPPPPAPRQLPETGTVEAEHRRAAMARSGAAQAGQGVMVALYPPRDVAGELARPGGEPADELHVTLAYLGQSSELGDLGPLRTALGSLAAGRPALEGAIGGIGLFPPSETSEGRAVAWAPVDVPGLAELRQAVVQVLDLLGLEPASNHGWTPHLTLAYLAPDAAPPAPAPMRPVRFTDLYLVVGEERLALPLKETP